MNSVRDGRWKLICRTGPKASLQLFDLQTDGNEQRNVAAENAEVVARLEHRLGAWKKQMPASPADQKRLPIEDEGTRERLHALGYLP